MIKPAPTPTPLLQSTLRHMVDPDFGLAHRLVELGAFADAPDVFVTCVDGGAASYMVDHEHPKWANCSNASGAAYQRDAACWATLGELAERYCAAIYDRDAMISCRQSSLPARAVPVDDMILFSGPQYDQDGFLFKPYNPSQEYVWKSGIDYLSGAEVFAPAQFLYLSFEWLDQMLMQTVSTGLACHSDMESACLSAMLELIERDGFAAAWALGMALPCLELSMAERLCLSLDTQRALASDRLKVRLFALPNEFGVANIVAVVEHVALGYGAFGAAASLSPFKAIDKAVLEAQHTWIGMSQMVQPYTDEDAISAHCPDPQQIKTPHDHAQYYMHEKTWAELGWFIADEGSVTIAQMCPQPAIYTAAELSMRMSENGYECFMFDLTTEDIDALGLRVVRALVPGMQPLCFGVGLISEDRRRLRSLANFWKHAIPKCLNQQPHPFP